MKSLVVLSQHQCLDLVVTVAVEKVTFWGLAYPFDADGKRGRIYSASPAPSLIRNSLICKVGNDWYQGGVIRGFKVKSDGLLYLRTNDDIPEDNMGKWYVEIFVIKDIQSLINGEYNYEINALMYGFESLRNEFNDLWEELKTEHNRKELQEKLQSFGLEMFQSFLIGLGGVS